MPVVTFRRSSIERSVRMRFVDLETAEPADNVDETTPGIHFWYERDAGARVDFVPVALDSLESSWTAGGVQPIGDGYVRVDIPDAVCEFGADSVLIGGGATGLIAIGPTILLTGSAPDDGLLPEDNTQSSIVNCAAYIQEAPDPTHEGCPVRTKRRHVAVNKGVAGIVEWTMRASNTKPANFSDCIPSGSLSNDDSSAEVKVRFQGCDRGKLLGEVDATIIESRIGMIEFPLPACVYQHSGIYQFQAALLNNGSPVFIDSGIISVEHGLWGDTGHMGGPPTIEDIRFAIKDREAENDLLRAVEFDDAEILEAIRWPVMQFNEKPPSLSTRYNCNNFPFRYYWIQAIVARLLIMASHHYLRNKMQAASSGLSVDDKDKNAEYTQFAQLYLQEWQEFLSQKKVELNAQEAWGTVDSGYMYGRI
jgi:hypothetical protein